MIPRDIATAYALNPDGPVYPRYRMHFPRPSEWMLERARWVPRPYRRYGEIVPIASGQHATTQSGRKQNQT